MIRRIAQTLTGLSLTIAGAGLVHAEMRLNLQQPETIIAHEIYHLHTVILVICVIIFVAVFGAMFYALWKHRKSVGHDAEQFHEHTIVEILWTVIPFLILVGMAIPATKTILAMKDTSGTQVGLIDAFTNYGRLVTPPIPVADLQVHQPDGGMFSFAQYRGKWVLVTVDSGACGDYCRRKLYLLRQIRLTQGMDRDRIERAWLIDDGLRPDARLAVEYEGTRQTGANGSALLAKLAALGASRDQIYVIDPLGNLMLTYDRDPDPNRMKQDLTRLVRLSGAWVPAKD